MNLQPQDPSGRPGAEGLAPPAGSAVVWRRSDRARRYRLWLGRDGAAVMVIPRRGSEREARRFLEQQRDWLDRARAFATHELRGPVRLPTVRGRERWHLLVSSAHTGSQPNAAALAKRAVELRRLVDTSWFRRPLAHRIGPPISSGR